MILSLFLLNQIKKMKKKRNEIKDRIDIKLIDKTSKDINIYISENS